MKKKFLVILTAIIMVLACAFTFVACGGDDEVEGTYYLYYNGVKSDSYKLVLKGGNVTYTFSDEERTETTKGTYKLDGKNIKITITDGPTSKTDELIYVSDGVYYINETYYCKDGKTPPADAQTEE